MSEDSENKLWLMKMKPGSEDTSHAQTMYIVHALDRETAKEALAKDFPLVLLDDVRGIDEWRDGDWVREGEE